MRKIIAASVAVVALSGVSSAAFAYSHIYSSEAGAQATCPQGEVVWIDLNKSVYFHKAQEQFGKSGGAFACVSAARDRGYREAMPVVQQASKPN